MTHKLPDLPYDYSALEPHIDTRTMAVHHDKHHAAYVKNLNTALESYPDLQEVSALSLLRQLDDVPEAIKTAVRNNGGGHVNHSFFWPSLSPKGGGVPRGSVATAVEESFGSFENMQKAFSQAALTLFGAGWTWLCVNNQGELIIVTTPNQDNPISQGLIPILGLDVWEHAYYIKYENRRADYIAAWWNVVNWDYVGGNLVAVNIGRGVDAVADWAKTSWNQLFGKD